MVQLWSSPSLLPLLQNVQLYPPPPSPATPPHKWCNHLINQMWHISVLQSSSVRGVSLTTGMQRRSQQWGCASCHPHTLLICPIKTIQATILILMRFNLFKTCWGCWKVSTERHINSKEDFFFFFVPDEFLSSSEWRKHVQVCLLQYSLFLDEKNNSYKHEFWRFRFIVVDCVWLTHNEWLLCPQTCGWSLCGAARHGRPQQPTQEIPR